MKNQDLCWMSAYDLANDIKKKKISPVELVRELLERINAVNPKINAYVTVVADSAMKAAKEAEDAVTRGKEIGPLHGIPFAVKDLTFTKGVRTTMGSKLMEDFVPEEDAVHVSRLKKAGAILLGKTNTPEFGSKAVTDNVVFGITRNPWNTEKTAGGSSGGSAAAVATGMGPLATGSDGGGSIRVPASCCGVFGIKPQFGRVPIYPLYQQLELMNHEGAITRTVKDAALMLDVMAGPHWGDHHSISLPKVRFVESLEGEIKGLRVGWSPDLGYAKVSQQVRTVCEEAVKKFSEMGAEVEEVNPGFENPEPSYMTIFGAELAATLSFFGSLEKIKHKLHPLLVARVAPLENLKAVDYLKAMFARREIIAKLGKFFKTYELLLTPIMGVPPWQIGLPTGYVEEVDGEVVSPVGWLLTFPFNFTGQPAASIPAGWSDDGLPIGLQIVGRRNDEATLFRAAAAFEQERPWNQKRPPIDP